MTKPILEVYYSSLGVKKPFRATSGSAGWDIYSHIEADTLILLKPWDRILVPTGLYLNIPEDYFVSLRPRSGLAYRNGLCLPNAPATIDSDYKGELKVLVANFNAHKEIQIKNGERIAQLLLEKKIEFSWKETKKKASFSPSQRGDSGFGSTGLA